MSVALIAALVCGGVLAGALLVYARWERFGWSGLVPAGLRAAAVTMVIVLILNPVRAVRVSDERPTVLLDASRSMGAAGGQWAEALARADSMSHGGVILRFGSHVTPFDSTPPADGASRLAPALAAARGLGRHVVVITDGEISDAALLPREDLEGVHTVILARRPVPDAALTSVRVPKVATESDSIPIQLEVRTFGDVRTDSAAVTVTAGDRRIAAAHIKLPPSPGIAHRSLVVRPGVLTPGEHVLRVAVTAKGDSEPADDARDRVVRITERPAIVLIADGPDWESRFLYRALREVSGARVDGYVAVAEDDWRDMGTLSVVSRDRAVARAARARLLVARGSAALSRLAAPGESVWWWPTADSLARTGDWYAGPLSEPSPLSAVLAQVVWDSVPPLTTVLGIPVDSGSWRAIGAQLSRRGAVVPVLVGRVVGGRRTVTTAAGGLWRWAFRGGVAADAYRLMVAGALAWLLPSDVTIRGLEAGPVAERGRPLQFRWRGGEPPDSVEVTFEGTGVNRSIHLRFGSDGRADVELPVGIYRWRGGGSSGVVAVEPYSDEYLPQPRAQLAGSPGGTSRISERVWRQSAWPFAILILALALEWAWRQRKGLP